MNHKLKIGLEITGGLIGAYILYKLYANYQANQQAASSDLAMLPPLQMGGYAPSAGNSPDSNGGSSALDSLLQSILGTGSNGGTQTPSNTEQPNAPTGVQNTLQPITGVAPVGPEPILGGSHIGGSYGGVSAPVGTQPIIGPVYGIGTRLRIEPDSGTVIDSPDGVQSHIL